MDDANLDQNETMNGFEMSRHHVSSFLIVFLKWMILNRINMICMLENATLDLSIGASAWAAAQFPSAVTLSTAETGHYHDMSTSYVPFESIKFKIPPMIAKLFHTLRK